MCAYVCVYVSVCMYVCMYVCVYAYVGACMETREQPCVCIYVYVGARVCELRCMLVHIELVHLEDRG